MQLQFFVAGIHIDAYFCRELCHGFAYEVFGGYVGVGRNCERQTQEQQYPCTLPGRYLALIHGIGLLFSFAFHLCDRSRGQQQPRQVLVNRNHAINTKQLLICPSQVTLRIALQPQAD